MRQQLTTYLRFMDDPYVPGGADASSSESPQPIGLVAVADTLKTHAREAVSAVHRLGLKVAMLTGDNPRTARAIADLVKIDRVRAEVLPEQKTSEIRRLQHEG